MNQRVTICTVALGGWYHRGVARMIENFHAHSPGYELRAFVNVLPLGAPAAVIEGGYDYTAYCAKPFALLDAMKDSDIAILLDAAFYPIRSINPLVQHIHRNGYYLCENGYQVGEYSSDRCLERMACARETAWKIPEITSYCVGLNFGDGRCYDLLARWCGFAGDRLTVPGPHDNFTQARDRGRPLRNGGFVSKDPNVKGHRHDQTVLSILAHRLKMTNLTARPMFTEYAGHETEDTVLVNRGLGS